MYPGGSVGGNIASNSSDFKQEPLTCTGVAVGGNSSPIVQAGLNERLNTEYIDVPPDDKSISASITRTIAGHVGRCCTPRQILVVLRLLKAVTFCFLVLTFAADVMYIVFVEWVVSKEVNMRLGGFRDTTIRVYGLALAIMSILIELDMASFVKHFSGFKRFIPRALLLFFVSTVTNAHPMHGSSGCTYSSNNGGDDQYDDDDDGCFMAQIPGSSIVFQMVTSFVLAICALTYFILGILCFDRFTSRAFISNKDPVASTAIPQPNSGTGPQHLPVPGDDAEHHYAPP